ncbi:putative sodium-dependent multivitamin transporter [Tachypleus tridentatus]|uniref:putative sodium-dependent multivitamin transporter n=1 Tax=Tachypleus tridentatus TaxID=6853 RepID=UPI003FD17AB9
MEATKSTFGPVDYVVFSLMLTFSAAIGIYYRFSGGHQKTVKEYLLANQSMSVLPVAFSLMASFMSAITLLGVASENYLYGTQFVLINISYIIGTPISAYVFLPVFFHMQATSAYEYLERRFGKITRKVASLTFMAQMILYMSIVLYAPALTLSAVTGLSKWASIISVGLVCTFYCTIGGIKAVLWTDLYQSLLMFLSMFVVIIKGTYDAGGLQNVWHIAATGGRIQFFNFDPDPTVRHTVWTLAIGGIFTYTSIYGVNQAQVQRLLTIKTLKKAQLALFLNWPITTLLSITTSLTGLIIYANLHLCDPILHQEETNVKSPDQLLPYFVMLSLGHIPGLPGIFVSGIFSGALSTVSSALNSLAAVTLEDFLKPLWLGNGLSDRKAALVSKFLALGYGILCIILTYIAEQLGGVLQASLTIFGVVGGPLLGLFTLGMLFRKPNQISALVGLSMGLAFCFWIGFGAGAAKIPIQKLPLTDEGCTSSRNETISFTNWITTDNSTLLFNNTVYVQDIKNLTTAAKERYVFPLYKMSYMWYAGTGWLVTLVVGLLVSYIIGKNEDVDQTLLSPIVKLWTKPDTTFESSQLVQLSTENGDAITSIAREVKEGIGKSEN